MLTETYIRSFDSAKILDLKPSNVHACHSIPVRVLNASFVDRRGLSGAVASDPYERVERRSERMFVCIPRPNSRRLERR